MLSSRHPNQTVEEVNLSMHKLEHIYESIKKENPAVTVVCDGISGQLLLLCDDSVVLPLRIIFGNILSTATYSDIWKRLFNSTLKTGVLPVDWKRAFITPIYKKGSRHLHENDRPISLTAILCKIMERFVRDQVVTHLLEEKLLSNKQYGFIAGRSTIAQLLLYLGECIKKVANGDVVDSIYIDFSKAFDTVPHRRMLGKLEAYDIRGNSLSWIKGFLYDRTQEVVVNGTKSEPGSGISGIPQGSVLGPLLFVVYINDLLDNISSAGLMFADDTKIFRLISSREDALELQSDIAKLEDWSNTWQLRFNPDKCHVLSLGKFENIKYTHRYVVYNNEIEHVFDEKDLGVTIDSELKFDDHIAKKVRVANAIVGQIRQSFSYLDCDTFRRIYTAFVRSHLEYGQTIWSPYLLRNINAVENVQVRATKLVDGLGKLEYSERLKRLNIPTLAFRRKGAIWSKSLNISSPTISQH